MSLSISSPRKAVSTVVVYAILLVLAALFALPLAWVVLASLDPTAQMAIRWPENPSLANFEAILTEDITIRPLLNGLLIAGLGSAIVVVLAAIAAYPLSRYKARYNMPLIYGILFANALPVSAIMVPVYALFLNLGLVDSLPGVIAFLAAHGLPYAIWMMKNFMDAVPIELEEAAWVDGASPAQALRRILLPLMGPAVTAIFIFNFIAMWGNFFVPFILLTDPAKLPIAVSIYGFFGNNGVIVYGQLAAFSLVYSLPVIVLYLLVSRSFNGAFRMSGGVKG